MKSLATGARYLLGLAFVVFGLNGFLNFLPPPEMGEEAGKFMALMVGSGYILPVKILEVLGGLCLFLPRFVAIGLTLLGPILVNILIFHLVFEPATIVMGLVFTVLWFLIFWNHRDRFQAIWQG